MEFANNPRFKNINVKQEYLKWHDWIQANGRKYQCYKAGFRTWLANKVDYHRENYSDKTTTKKNTAINNAINTVTNTTKAGNAKQAEIIHDNFNQQDYQKGVGGFDLV